MQDLRDKLRKAGVVDKQRAREARTEARRERRAGQREPSAEEQRRRFEAKQAEQTRHAKEKQEVANRERERKELQERLRKLIRSHALLHTAGTDRPFHFMGRDRRIRRWMTSYELATRLTQGQIAIVEADDDPTREFAVVDAQTATRLEELEPGRILFWNKPSPIESELPTYGSGA